jgi:hypothetical protein
MNIIHTLKSKISIISLIAIIIFVFVDVSDAQFYSGSQMTFGRNRIQYTKDRKWSYFRFNNFDTYYYKGGQSLAIYTSSYADKQMKLIGKKLDFVPDSKIRFLIFNDLSDLKETNIGLITDDEYNVGGVTHVINNKVFLYFNGEHRDLENQIKRGIAQVYLNEMMFGGSTGAKIKNSILLSFPEWYTDGLISYIAEGWNTELDDKLRDGITTGTFKKFDRLNRTDKRIVSQSLWKFIELKYGAKSVSNVIYMAKINRSIENGYLYVLGISFNELMHQWLEYYTEVYQNDIELFETPQNPLLKKNKKKRVYSQARISKSGVLLAYSTNEIGKVRVYIKNLETGKVRRVMKFGYKLDEKVDYSYPLLSWSTAGDYLAIIYEKKNTNYIDLYDYKKRKTRTKALKQFDKIHDFSYNNRGNKIAVSAIVNGQSDIYILSLAGNSYKRITQDGYDDNYPRFVNNNSALIWSSNRVDDTLRIIKQTTHQIAEDTLRGLQHFDLYFYDLTKKSKILRRITNTPLANEIYPMAISNNKFAWLSDENGIYNRYVGQFDSTINYIDTTTHYRYYTKYAAVTNYNSNILEQDYNSYSSKYTEVVKVNGKFRMFLRDLPDFEDYNRLELINTAFMSRQVLEKRLLAIRYESLRKARLKAMEIDSNQSGANDVTKIKPSNKKHFRAVTYNDIKPKKNKSNIDINNYDFGGTLKDEGSEAALNAAKERGPADVVKAAYNSRPYNVEYNVSQIVTQVDFSYMNYSYQPFTNPQYPIYINNGFNAFIKLGVMDLLEDYRLVGGVKLSPSLQNNEYFLTFSNYKNRFDLDYTFHRNVIDESNADFTLTTHYIHEFFVKIGTPLDNIRGFRTTVALRNDNGVTRATDSRTLVKPDVMLNNAILRLEYVYDKSRKGGTNILFGTRYKVFAEYYQPIEYLDKNMIVLGFDYRKYTKIHKTFVWANRFAGSTSLGSNRLIYYMGGVDNWMNAKFNTNIQVDQEQPFAYQTLATNMRGFYQNIRNGNNFLLWNTELRFPPFQFFSKTPVKSQFWNNLMFVGFFDIGTAWTGINPYSDNNSLFKKEVYRQPVLITIINQDDPLVAGYGYGIRSQVFGYYMRADWAWGIENSQVHKKPVFYFSLGMDF